MREKIGPVAAFKLAITVARLPKTRSGKILRGTIKKIDAVAAGRLKGDEKLPAKMVLTVGGVALSFTVDGDIELG